MLSVSDKYDSVNERTEEISELMKLHIQAGFPLYFGIEIQGFFKDPEVAFSRTNSRRTFAAQTVLQRYSRTFKDLWN